MKKFLLFLILLLLISAAYADWNEGEPHKMHFPQLPDPQGWDVCFVRPLADDFKCAESGPITDIHFWISFWQDRPEWDPEFQMPQPQDWIIQIRADQPTGTGVCGFQPGQLLWQWTPGDGNYTIRRYGEGAQGFVCPPGGGWNPNDHQGIWQVNITDIQDYFIQEEGTHYWLVITNNTQQGEYYCGWKTSFDIFRCPGLWLDVSGAWRGVDVSNPQDPTGDFRDFAFVITNDGGTPEEADWGDAEDYPLGLKYPTLSVHNGAFHLINPNVFMGLSIDPEMDGQPTPPADGDDNDGNDDEDGVTFGPLIQGTPATMTVVCSVNGFVDAWIDYNQDALWGPAEKIGGGSIAVIPGANNISFLVPAGAIPGQTVARVRFSTAGGLAPVGGAQDGEVEDYIVHIVRPSYELDWGDAPDPSYPTLAANNGANHIIVQGLQMGPAIDPEPDGQPTPVADGDDLSGVPDEDGIFPMPMKPGQTSTIGIDMTASTINGIVQVWIDFDMNGSWADPGEHVVIDGAATAGMMNFFNFLVPNNAVPGSRVFTRVRLSTTRSLPFFGPAQDGEVEDHMLIVEEDIPELKWSQLPDLTPEGMDVDATEPLVLADDFECRFRGKISDITVFGSWLNDYIPFQESPEAVEFTLSIHEDIPADKSSTGYSMPGDVLWIKRFVPGEFQVMRFVQDIQEGWFDPLEPYYLPVGDTVCWLYHFVIKPDEAFCQKGEPDNPVIYWLDVQAKPHDPQARFGWKTSMNHWNDDAVWGEGFEPFFGPWFELIYPDQHPKAGDSIDLAFEILTSMPNYCCNCPDFNNDGVINFKDFWVFANDWLNMSMPAGFNSSDLDCDGDVDLADLKLFALWWLGSCPY